ncbi:MAG: chitobiase/beta-hexosaminidase C-terminal domain-containing protein, partial [Thermofilaceae archaeon]
RYTTDGRDPDESSPVYAGPLTFTATTTLKARAYKSGMTPSAVVVGIYSVQPMLEVAKPEFDPAPGVYTGSVTVRITCATSGAVIRYTTDGRDPDESSPVYAGPLTFTATTTLKARAYKSGMTPSAVATGNYTISSVSSDNVVMQFTFRITLLEPLDFWPDLDGGGEAEIYFKIYFIGRTKVGWDDIIAAIDTKEIDKKESLFVIKRGKEYVFRRQIVLMKVDKIGYYWWFAIRVDIFENDLLVDDFLGSIPNDNKQFSPECPLLFPYCKVTQPIERIYVGAIDLDEKILNFNSQKIKITIIMKRL